MSPATLGILAAGALVALAVALGLRRLVGGYARPEEDLRVLAPREAALLRAAAEAFYPPGGPVPPSGAEVGIPAYVDRYLAAQDPPTRRLMRLLFLLVEQATLVFPAPGRRGWRRFSSLDVEQRVAVLRGWSESRLFARRLVFTSLRAIVSMAYLNHPRVARLLRLAPYAIETPVVDADLLYPPIGRSRDAIRYGPADRTPPSDGTPLDLEGPLHPDFAEGRS